MTDPGTLELVASWKIGESGGVSTFHEVRITRDAPSETVTHWERRFLDQVAADLVTYPPYNP